jgi:hypothetical protein
VMPFVSFCAQFAANALAVVGVLTLLSGTVNRARRWFDCRHLRDPNAAAEILLRLLPEYNQIEISEALEHRLLQRGVA